MDLTGKMEKLEMFGSLKDIPIPPKDVFIKDLMLKMQDLIHRIRWRVHAGLNDGSSTDENPENMFKSVFKSTKMPPANVLLYPFEEAIWRMLREIKFRKYPKRRNNYLRNLDTRIKEMRSSKGIFVVSDKTKNIYSMMPKTYDSLLRRELNRKYKIVDEGVLRDINIKAKKIIQKLGIDDRTYPITPRTPRFSLKDHKDNYVSNPQVRLICPRSSDIGRVSKLILQRCIKK